MNSSSRRAAAALLLALAATVMAGADSSMQGGGQRRPPSAQTARPAARPPEIESFVAEMNAAPPDIAADALLRLAGSGKVKDAAWKKELIERAFTLAGAARATLRRGLAAYVTASADTSASYLSNAYDLGLDTLSLRARAVRAMLALDPQRGLELFWQITLKLEPLKCDDALAYDVSVFYALLAEAARASFTDAEARQGARSRFMLSYVEAVNSPVQVGPAAKAILSAQVSSDETALLASALAHSLAGIMPDDRSFTSAVERGGATREVAALVRELEKRKDNSASGLADAYRKFFRTGLTAERCAEDVPRGNMTYYLADANASVFKESPLKLEELKPSGVGKRAAVSQYWRTPGSQKLLDDYKGLRFDADAESNAKDGEIPTRADAGTPEWDAQLRRFLSDLEDWRGSDEGSALDFFNQQQNLYEGLLDIVPHGQARAEVLASWLKSLKGARDGDAEILRRLYVTSFLKAVVGSPLETRAGLMNRLVYSDDPLISASAKVAKLKL